MDGIEQKLGSILSNPEMMQKIMGFAQSLGLQDTPQNAKQEAPAAPQLPQIDGNLLKAVSGMARQSGVDRDQQALLRALSPYLSLQRIHKLENAMRAAKMARLAASALTRQEGKSQAFR